MAADAGQWLRELVARVQLSRGAPTLISLTAGDDRDLEAARGDVARLLGANGLAVRDLGAMDSTGGPVAWAEASREEAGDVFVLSLAARSSLARRAFADLVNAQRQSLRDLAGPLVVLVSTTLDAALREHAPDFVTWVAQGYDLPAEADLRRLLQAAGVRASAAAEPAVDATPPIRFLHVSDLHLRPSVVKRHDQDRVLNGLFAMLAGDRAASPLDLIFVTGDLANAGVAEEYAVVVAFLQRLMEVTGVPHERVFVVPGNHDVDRRVGRWLLRTLDSDADSTEFFVNEGSRRWHAEKFAAYRAAMEGLLGPRALGLRVGAGAVETADVRGARVAVASFNSAWFAQGDDDIEKLWLGDANVAQAGEAARAADVAVALMHHPTAHLSPVEQGGVENLLERAFDVVLRGHLHREKTRVSVGARGALMEVAAPAAYQGSQWPNGCFIGELRAGARTMRLRPFMFGSGADPWVLDARVFPDDAAEGYCRTFSLGKKSRAGGVAERGDASPTRAFWALERADRLELARRLGIEGANDDDLERRAAEHVSRSGEGADVWRALASRAGAPGRTEALEGFARSIAREMVGEAPVRKISRLSPSFLTEVLAEIAKRWKSVLLSGGGTDEQTLAHILVAILDLLLDGPILEQLPAGRLRPDITIGAPGEPREHRAVIEVAAFFRDHERHGRVEQVGRYMQEMGISQGALVLFSAASKATLRRVVHVSGAEVLVLELPLG